jgi:hypothetical protein
VKQLSARKERPFGSRVHLGRAALLLGTLGVGCAHATTLGAGGSGGASGPGSGGATGSLNATGTTTSNIATNGVNTGAGGSQANTATSNVTSTAVVTSAVTTSTGGVCGDGICDPNENCMNCPSDCPTCPTTAATTGAATSSVTSGVGGGTCHDVCTVGPAEDPNACAAQPYGACVADVCSSDSFCCMVMWDDTCVSDVDNSFVCLATNFFC